MAGKKSFTTQQNPALAFISAADPAGEVEKTEQETPHIKTSDAPKGYKANPLFVETKSRRLQLLVQPSLYEAVKARAKAEGQSVNELVHSILEAFIKGEDYGHGQRN